MALTSALNPDVVKTALDKVFYQYFDGDTKPELATAESAVIFNQDSLSNAATIQEVFKGTGYWGLKAEEQDVPQATPRVANKITFYAEEFAQAVDISKNFFDDNINSTLSSFMRIKCFA